MKPKIIIAVAVVILLALIVEGAKFYADRREQIAAYEVRLQTFRWVHSNLVEKGPEYARLHSEVMILGNYNGLEDIVSHPFAPWWPDRLNGATERGFFFSAQSRNEKIRALHNAREEFQGSIGVTNRQDETKLFKRMVEMMNEPTTGRTVPPSAGAAGDPCTRPRPDNQPLRLDHIANISHYGRRL